MKPTDNMLDALHAAASRQEGLRRLHDDRAHWPAHPATLAALVRHGLLRREQDTTRRGLRVTIWRITDDGVLALNPAPLVQQARPIYLARGSIRYRLTSDNRWAVVDTTASRDYTSDPRRSIDTETHPATGRTTAVETLIDATSLAVYAEQARERDQDRKRENGRTLDTHPLGERMKLAQRIAAERRMDVSDDCRLIRHMLAAGREAHATARMTQLEIRLGQRVAA